MTADTDRLRDDLAFLRALVSGGGYARPLGGAYLAAGVIYGVQLLLHLVQMIGLIPLTGLWPLAIGVGPTLVFIPTLTWIIRRSSAAPAGSTGRAIGSVFGAMGAANLALIAVIGLVAWQERSITTWLIFPCAVFVLQGAAWLVMWTLVRRAWLALVAVGWLAAAIAMAVSVQWIVGYLLAATLGIWLCMALPGWIMIRRRGGA